MGNSSAKKKGSGDTTTAPAKTSPTKPAEETKKTPEKDKRDPSTASTPAKTEDRPSSHKKSYVYLLFATYYPPKAPAKAETAAQSLDRKSPSYGASSNKLS